MSDTCFCSSIFFISSRRNTLKALEPKRSLTMHSNAVLHRTPLQLFKYVMGVKAQISSSYVGSDATTASHVRPSLLLKALLYRPYLPVPPLLPLCPLLHTYLLVPPLPELKITAGHWLFSVHICQMANHFPKWSAAYTVVPA